MPLTSKEWARQKIEQIDQGKERPTPLESLFLSDDETAWEADGEFAEFGKVFPGTKQRLALKAITAFIRSRGVRIAESPFPQATHKVRGRVTELLQKNDIEPTRQNIDLYITNAQAIYSIDASQWLMRKRM